MLSVCLITKNEEKFLGKCLQSIHDIASEIIIVDAYSTDNTLLIARKYTDKIFLREWNEDFAAARNFSLEKATNEWILIIDADEYLINGDRVLGILEESENKNVGGFLLERKDVFHHPESGKLDTYNVGIVRLVRKQPFIRFRNKIHEEIHTSVEDAQLEVKIAREFSLIHQVNEYDFSQLITKQKKYLLMIEESLNKQPDNIWLLYHQAKTLWFLGEIAAALHQYIAISEAVTNHIKIRAAAINHLAILLMEEGKEKDAIVKVEESLHLVPDQSLGYLIKFDILYEMNEFQEALNVLGSVKTSIENCEYENVIPGDLYQREDLVSYKRGCVYLAINQYAKAEKSFFEGIRVNDVSLNNHYGLAILYCKMEQYETASDHIRLCMELNPAWIDAQVMQEFLDNL